MYKSSNVKLTVPDSLLIRSNTLSDIFLTCFCLHCLPAQDLLVSNKSFQIGTVVILKEKTERCSPCNRPTTCPIGDRGLNCSREIYKVQQRLCYGDQIRFMFVSALPLNDDNDIKERPISYSAISRFLPKLMRPLGFANEHATPSWLIEPRWRRSMGYVAVD